MVAERCDDDDTIAVTNGSSAHPQLRVAVVLTASISVFSKGYVQAGVGNDTIKVTGTGVTSASLRQVLAMTWSITGGTTDGSRWHW